MLHDSPRSFCNVTWHCMLHDSPRSLCSVTWHLMLHDSPRSFCSVSYLMLSCIYNCEYARTTHSSVCHVFDELFYSPRSRSGVRSINIHARNFSTRRANQSQGNHYIYIRRYIFIHIPLSGCRIPLSGCRINHETYDIRWKVLERSCIFNILIFVLKGLIIPGQILLSDKPVGNVTLTHEGALLLRVFWSHFRDYSRLWHICYNNIFNYLLCNILMLPPKCLAFQHLGQSRLEDKVTATKGQRVFDIHSRRT